MFKIFNNSKRHNNAIIPKGWYVHEAYQDPLHMLWSVTLLSYDDLVNKTENIRYITSNEMESFEDAINDCNFKIESKLYNKYSN